MGEVGREGRGEGNICFLLIFLLAMPLVTYAVLHGCIWHRRLFFIVTAAADPTYETTDMSPEEVRPVYTELAL